MAGGDLVIFDFRLGRMGQTRLNATCYVLFELC